MSQEIRVLHILHSMNRGGAETMLMNYYRNMDRRKVQFDFLLTVEEKSDYEDEIYQMGGKIFHITSLTPKTIFKYITDISRFLKEHPEYKIVHSHTSSKSVLPLFVAKRRGVPIRISHSHNAFVYHNTVNIKEMVRKILRTPLKLVSNYNFACSKDAAIWLYGEKYWSQGKVTLLKNAIESQRFDYNQDIREQYREKFQLKNQLVFGHVGQFRPQKNHSFLLDIFSEIVKINPECRLVLVGDGALRKEIEHKVKQLQLEKKVIFTGLREDIPKLLQMMDVFLFPSLFEGLGIVLIEAQAAGLPCYTSARVVPKEAQVTPLLKYIDLGQSAKVWAEQILAETAHIQRKSTQSLIVSSGYDMIENAVCLQSFYLDRASEYQSL